MNPSYAKWKLQKISTQMLENHFFLTVTLCFLQPRLQQQHDSLLHVIDYVLNRIKSHFQKHFDKVNDLFSMVQIIQYKSIEMTRICVTSALPMVVVLWNGNSNGSVNVSVCKGLNVQRKVESLLLLRGNSIPNQTKPVDFPFLVYSNRYPFSNQWDIFLTVQRTCFYTVQRARTRSYSIDS